MVTPTPIKQARLIAFKYPFPNFNMRRRAGKIRKTLRWAEKRFEKRAEEFLMWKLLKFRAKEKEEPFTKSKELLMKRFPDVPEERLEKIARDFENKHFDEVLSAGKSIWHIRKLEKAKKELPRKITPEEKRKRWLERKQAELEMLELRLDNSVATVRAFKEALEDFEFRRKISPALVEVNIPVYETKDLKGRKKEGYWSRVRFRKEQLMDEIEYYEEMRKKAEEKIKEIEEALKKK